jgi:uncharacterized protein
MRPPKLLLFLPLLLLPLARSSGQQNTDPKQVELVAYAHFKALKPVQLSQLLWRAQLGDAEAQFWAGKFYAEGRVPKNAEEGARWFLKSAEQGFAPAQRVYGLTLRLANPSAGETWMRRAAEHGDTEAQFWLGVAYEQNWFGTVDIQEATKWYRKAAEGGNPDAQFELGQKYQDGEIVDQDYKLAAEWFRRAADHVPDLGGAGQAKNRLGQLYMEGLGVPQDYAQAYFWFSLNVSEASALEAKAHLTMAQISENERLISDWNERHQLSPEVAAALQIMEANSR